MIHGFSRPTSVSIVQKVREKVKKKAKKERKKRYDVYLRKNECLKKFHPLKMLVNFSRHVENERNTFTKVTLGETRLT